MGEEQTIDELGCEEPPLDWPVSWQVSCERCRVTELRARHPDDDPTCEILHERFRITFAGSGISRDELPTGASDDCACSATE